MNNEAITAELEAIANKNGGIVTPELVEKHAQRKTSPLHDYFVWDEKVAAYKFRIEQARRLIRSVTIITRTEKHVIETPRYVRDPLADASDQGYSSVPRLMTDEDAARQAIINEFKRAASALQRARDLSDALSLSDEVDAIIHDVNQLAQKSAPIPETVQ